MASLRLKVERAKLALSTKSVVQVEVDKGIYLNLTREKFVCPPREKLFMCLLYPGRN